MSETRPQDAATLRPDPVTLACADGQRLQGHFFPARGGIAAAPVLISPATGVRQQFYWRFADWLASQGHAPYAWSVLGAVTQVTEKVEAGAVFLFCRVPNVSILGQVPDDAHSLP